MNEYDTKILELSMKKGLLNLYKEIIQKDLKYLMKIFGEGENYDKYYKHFKFLTYEEIFSSIYMKH